MQIAETGRPTSADVFGCPQPFIQPTADALMHWTWEPVMVDGVAIPVSFDLPVNPALP